MDEFKKRIWLIKDGSPLPTDAKDIRLLRIGLLADILQKMGHHVTWWTSTFNHQQKKFRADTHQHIEISPNYTIKMLHACGYKKNISLQRIQHNKQMAKYFLHFSKKLPKPDIILSGLPAIELAHAATIYGNEMHVPTIVDLRDMWPDIILDLFPNFLKPIARIGLAPMYHKMKKTCQNATALTGITQEFLNWGLHYANRSQKTFDAVYPHGYPDTPPSATAIATAESFWEQQGIHPKGEQFTIAFVGSLTRSHQLEHVILAAKQFNQNVKLVICGERGKLDQLKKLANNHPNIIFPGWVNHAQIYTLLRRASVGIAPYIARKDFMASIPNKAIEYLSAGLPIITCLPGVLTRLIEDHEVGFKYENTSPEDLVKVVQYIKDNDSVLQKYSTNCLTLYNKLFRAETVYTQMADYLCSL